MFSVFFFGCFLLPSIRFSFHAYSSVRNRKLSQYMRCSQILQSSHGHFKPNTHNKTKRISYQEYRIPCSNINWLLTRNIRTLEYIKHKRRSQFGEILYVQYNVECSCVCVVCLRLCRIDTNESIQFDSSYVLSIKSDVDYYQYKTSYSIEHVWFVTNTYRPMMMSGCDVPSKKLICL